MVQNLKRPHRNKGASFSIFLLGLLLSMPAIAGDNTRQYHIPAQSLNNALMQFAADSHLELMFTAEKIRGLRTDSLDGNMTPAQALSRLLQSSGMTYRFVDAKTVTVEPVPSNLKKTAVVDEKPEPQSNNETGSDTTLPKVTVEADADNPYGDPTWQTDPYNTDYVLPKATAGAKTNTPIMETPMNVQVISKQVLKDQQVINLDQALKNVSGITTQKQGGAPGSNTESLFLRGFATTALFRNGFRMDGNSFGFNQQFANVESVEVLKGPAAVLYGRVEPGGAVNVITKQPRATPYYSLNQQFGSYDLYRTSIDATGPLTKDDTLLYRVNASFQSNNSFRDLVNGEDVFIAPIFKWNISPSTQATLEMEYQNDKSSVDQQILPFQNNHVINLPHSRNLGERNLAETENIFVGFNWSHQFNEDWSIKHQTSFKRQDVDSGILAFPAYFHFDTQDLERFVGINRTKTDTVSTNLDLTGHFKTWGLEHTLLFGGDYYGYSDSSYQAYFDTSRISYVNPVHPGSGLVINPSAIPDRFKQSVDNYGLYAQDQIKLPYHFHVMGGLRYQYIHSSTNNGLPPITNDAVTPRVGLLWQPQNWLSLYSNYAESFGSNYGSFSFNGTVTGFGKPLGPTSAQQWEIGAKTEFFNGRLRVSMAYFDLRKQNTPTTDIQHPAPACGGGGCQKAVGEVRSRGPELDIQGEILPGWNVIGTYAYQDVRISKSANGDVGQRLGFVPRNVASAWTTYEIQKGDFKGLQIGGGVNLQDSVIDGALGSGFKSPGYALVGLMAGYGFEVGKSKINLQLNVDNLLDKRNFTNVGVIGDPNNAAIGQFSTPRTFMGSINVQY